MKMKRIVCLLVALVMILGLGTGWVSAEGNSAPAANADKAASLLKGVQQLNHSAVRIEGGKVVYIDPFMIEGEPKDGDIIFITHAHGDHFSPADIKKVMKKDAALVITKDGAAGAKKEGFTKVVTVGPSKDYTVSGIKFKTVPAYNTNKQWHTAKDNWVGYIISMNNANYYLAGDTDVIPEMKKIKADVAFLPISGTYTMTAQEAAEAANIIKPQIAIPYHYGAFIGTTDDAVTFVQNLKAGIQGVVLRDLLKGVEHFKQSTLKFKSDKVIYFDPFQIEGEPKDADMILVTHTHGDHFSPVDIKKVMKKDTVLVIPQDGVEAAVKEGLTNIVTVLPSKSYEVDGFKFKTVPSYNTNKDFHKKDSNWVGYIASINSTSYYIAGDTDVIPEMKEIKANVVFLPVGGTYTMTAAEAANAANTIKPLVAVPIHFGDVVGTREDAVKFSELLDKGIKGVILKK